MLLDAIFLFFWPKETRYIKILAFVPFFCYFLTANFYYTQCLFDYEHRVQGIWSEVELLARLWEEEPLWKNGDVLKDRAEPVVFGLFLWFLLQQIVNEAVQLRNEERVVDYFKSSTSNYYDFASILFNMTTLVLRRLHDYDQVSLHSIRVIASVGLVLIYIQLFYWLRTQQSLAFYVDLITQTLIEIKPFMVVLLLFIFTF